MILNGTHYKKILLDTNVLREFLFENDGTERNKQGMRSFSNYMQNYILPSERYVLLISVFSLLELQAYKDLFDRFLARFHFIPLFVVMPDECILEQEFCHYKTGTRLKLDENSNKIIYAISYFNNPLQQFTQTLFSHIDIGNTLKNLQETAQQWSKERKHTKYISENNYYRNNEVTIIKRVVSKHFDYTEGSIELECFPGLRLMQFSQYKKVHFTSKPIEINDVMDVKISCVVPYVDIVIIEKQQAEFYKQSQSIIPQMSKVRVLTLTELRMKGFSNA